MSRSRSITASESCDYLPGTPTLTSLGRRLYNSPMRFPAVFLVFLMIAQTLPAEERKTQSDFLAPPADEQPLVSSLAQGISPKTGLWLSSAGLLAGFTLSLVSTHSTLNHAFNDIENPAVQRGIVLTGACLIGSTICMVLTDFFLEEMRKSKPPATPPTSEE